MKTNINKFVLFCICFLGLAIAAHAQSELKKPKKMMDNLNYQGAIMEYLSILKKKDYSEAKINLADCYRKVGDWENAEYWYSQVVRLTEAQPIHKLYYGMALQHNGKCSDAKQWYSEYTSSVPDEIRSRNLERACELEEELKTKNAGIYEVTHLSFNSALDDFSPTIDGNKLVFASERDQGSSVKRVHCWTGLPFLELYEVETKGECSPSQSFGKAQKFSSKLNSKYHDAVVTFAKDDSEIYFTRNNLLDGKVGKDKDGAVRLKIYSAKKTGKDSYGELTSLPFNSDEYSVTHPSLSSDGNKLYFSSDMPGGYGGMDLYVSERENGRWGAPKNLGPQINTENTEVFPTVTDSTFFFASDGHIGLGGLDIYMVNMTDGMLATSNIDNLGYPLNSSSDDFGLVLNSDGTCGYFTSDRPGGSGRDDIYNFVKTGAPVELYVYDESNKKPIHNATVNNACTNLKKTTNEKGITMFEVRKDDCCDFLATADGYIPNTVKGCVQKVGFNTKERIEIPLKRALMFKLEGVVFDQATGLPISGATVNLVNDCNKENPTAVTTDETGRYSFTLDPDCCYSVKGAKNNYLTSSQDNQCTKGLDKDFTFQTKLYLQPTVVSQTNKEVINAPTYQKPVLNPQTNKYETTTSTGTPQVVTGVYDGVHYKDGKIVESTPMWEPSPVQQGEGSPIAYLLNVYYDFDKCNIREGEGVDELNKLLTMMKDNPNLIVEVASHTDSRGSDRYNTRLSQRRAESVMKWLCKRGIERSRIIAKGYGEVSPVNDCRNQIKCDERQHQMNRRSEFRILGCRNCEEQMKSTPNDNTKVDPCVGCPF